MESRIYLRALEPDDYKTTIAWRNDDEINSMLGGLKRFVSKAYEAKWMQDTIFQSKDVKLAICLKQNGLHIGNVYMTGIDELNQHCTSHILIGNKAYWGQGYAGEAMRLAIDYMFGQRNIHRIEALVLDTNQASLRMHEKLGYKEEGIKRQSVYKDGAWHDQHILSLLRDDYAKQ